MSKVDVVLNSNAVTEIMRSSEMQGMLQELASNIVGRCGGSYETDVYVGKSRANASISTRDSATYHRNLKDNELLRALK